MKANVPEKLHDITELNQLSYFSSCEPNCIRFKEDDLCKGESVSVGYITRIKDPVTMDQASVNQYKATT